MLIQTANFKAAKENFTHFKQKENFTKGTGKHELSCTAYRVHFESKKTDCEYSCEVIENTFKNGDVFYSLTNQGFNETEYISCSALQIKNLINTLCKKP